MGIFFDLGREMKRLQNDYFFGDAFEFDFLVRLNDDYKKECGPWIEFLFNWVLLKYTPKYNYMGP